MFYIKKIEKGDWNILTKKVYQCLNLNEKYWIKCNLYSLTLTKILKVKSQLHGTKFFSECVSNHKLQYLVYEFYIHFRIKISQTVFEQLIND